MEGLEQALAAVRLAVFDFDGVFTDNRWLLVRRGGEGCVREFCDAVWHAWRAGG